MENTIRLGRVQVPDQLTVLQRRRGRHHAVNPFGIIQSLVDEGRSIIPLAVHVEIVGSLERNSSAATDFFVADGAGQADLAGHRGAADDGLVQVELLDEGGDAADVTVW